MKRRLMEFAVVLVLSLLFTQDSISSAQPVATMECGALSTDTTFTLAASPYDICMTGLTVNPGVTLTVEAGATLQFESGPGDQLTVQGALTAIGTAAQPITFAAVSATPGSWRGISADGSVGAPASVHLDYVTLEYGGVNGTYGAQVYADHATVSIAHSSLHDGAGNGLYASFNAQFDVRQTSFVNNGLNAIELNTPTVDLLMSGLSATGNGTNGVRILGATTWPGQRHWTAPGIPYIVDGVMSNAPGDQLTIDPGSELQFTGNGYLSIGGVLDAPGTPEAPILMTGQTKTSGAWRGIYLSGGAQQALAQFDHVTVEYGGSDVNGANIELQFGSLIARHSTIRYSAKDGIRFDNNDSGSILDSQIYGNGAYGIRNLQPTRGVLATNDWWGDAGGPLSDVTACPSGLGEKVTAGVFYVPILTASNGSAPFPLSAMPTLTLTPRRWFTPADGVTRDYFDLTLTDGNGAPIPGRSVHLTSTLGTVVDGGITDANGKALAYLTALNSTGDALVTAFLNGLTGCEGVISPQATVTFTTPISATDLMPNAASPYFSEDIHVSPMPVVAGSLETISTTLTNPLSSPITVDVEFGYVQASIGLAFGPIKTFTGLVIPANGSLPLSASVIPPISGHYCVQVTYTLTAIGSAPVLAPQAGPQLKQFNWNAQPAPTGPPSKGDGLAKTRKSLKFVNSYVKNAYDTKHIAIPLAVANAGIEWDLNNAEKISNSLQGDPPRQDYTLISLPVVKQLPPQQAGGGISVARAAALNDLDHALAVANAAGQAAAIALDRYGGASAAGDMQWASTQNGVMLEYERQMGVALVDAAAKIDALIAVANSEGQTSLVFSAADVVTMQVTLQSGFTAQEIADAQTIGLSDADIEAIRQSILAADPNDLAGDIFTYMVDIRDQFNNLGHTLQNPYAFYPALTVTGGDAAPDALATTNNMVQVNDSVMSFPLRNPGASPALITLKVRRLDLPADWTVNVSPAQVNLAPGAQATITVTVSPGSPTRQNTSPRVAVEAYNGTSLLGGVTFDIIIPHYAPFDGKLRTYVPAIQR